MKSSPDAYLYGRKIYFHKSTSQSIPTPQNQQWSPCRSIKTPCPRPNANVGWPRVCASTVAKMDMFYSPVPSFLHNLRWVVSSFSVHVHPLITVVLLTTKYQYASVTALLDSGSADNFISASLCNQYNPIQSSVHNRKTPLPGACSILCGSNPALLCPIACWKDLPVVSRGFHRWDCFEVSTASPMALSSHCHLEKSWSGVRNAFHYVFPICSDLSC